MKWYIHLACLRSWWHFTTLLDIAVKVMGFWAEEKFQWGLRFIMSRRLLACHAKFLFSTNMIRSVIQSLSRYSIRDPVRYPIWSDLSTPKTARSNRDENTRWSQSAAELVLFCLFCFFFFSFPIILSGKEIYNGAFLHPAPAAHNWHDAEEVRYFKAIIKEWNSCQGLLKRRCEHSKLHVLGCEKVNEDK